MKPAPIRDDDEWRKTLTATIRTGQCLTIFDNVDQVLNSASLALALTTSTWTDRVLGFTELVTLPQRTVFVATGNNIVLGGDLARRCYWIRLDAQCSEPWRNRQFRHPDLRAWVRENRGRLLSASLTLARAWFVASSGAGRQGRLPGPRASLWLSGIWPRRRHPRTRNYPRGIGDGDGGYRTSHARFHRSKFSKGRFLMNRKSTRRTALTNLGAWASGSPLLAAVNEQYVRPGDEPKLEGEPPGRFTPRDQAVNVFEVEAVAQRKLGAALYATIAGGDRRAFDRILLRPRRFVNVEHLDLTADLFGEKMFTPVLVGPAAHQQALDPDGELAMVRGAAKARATVVISSRSSQPIEKIAVEAKTTLRYQVYPESDMGPEHVSDFSTLIFFRSSTSTTRRSKFRLLPGKAQSKLNLS
jgi:hypothetical protein